MYPSQKHELINFHDDIFSLLIKTVDRDDSGRYTCLAKNEYGEAKSEALLNVVGEDLFSSFCLSQLKLTLCFIYIFGGLLINVNLYILD